MNAGLEKEIVPGGLCINDSNIIIEAVRLGKGIALERRSLVQDAITRGELVQLTSITAPYPWPYWLVTAQSKEEKPEVGLFVAWLDEEVAAWRRAVSAVESNQP
ncbi:hypothetical protein L423_02963 [Enterobacter roggenkampii]|nr:hypothetical protein L423_02963 [Enterobacter roggenkampii]